ncbi:MAG TPA: GAF domain-containing protein [Anaerolineales bacterium]|nr:GAF domain-containing protein [Anaerolineales bacterium]
MISLIRKIFSPPIFPDDEEKTRAAELLNIVLNTLIVVIFLALVGLILGGTVPLSAVTIISIFFLSLFFMKIPARLGYVKQASIAIVILITAVLSVVLAINGTILAPGIIFYLLGSVMSGLLISRQAMFWSVGANSIIFIGLLWAQLTGRLPEPNYIVTIQQGIVFVAASLLTAVLLSLYLKRQQESLERVRQSEEQLASINTELEQRVDQRTAELANSTLQIQNRASQLEAIANTARSAATIQKLDQLLPAIAEDISVRFGFYHVGIFLLDSNKEYAILSAANSEGGQNMLARGHRLKVGEQGIVGYVTSSGYPRIALDVGEDAVFFNNPDLPETHSEVALPLKFGREIIGALDIQSTESNAFFQEDVEIFSVLADQVSVAIQNTRSLEQAQRAIQELEIASRQSTNQAWKGFMETVRAKGYRYDGIKPEPLKESSKATKDKDALSVPVQLRGETIGRLKLRPVDQSRKWTEDELAIIESTAERVAIALESARLLEDAQKRASRETFLSGMAAKLSGSYKLDSILRDTVEDLGQTLQGSKVTIQLVNPSAPPTSASDKDNGASETRKGSE